MAPDGADESKKLVQERQEWLGVGPHGQAPRSCATPAGAKVALICRSAVGLLWLAPWSAVVLVSAFGYWDFGTRQGRCSLATILDRHDRLCQRSSGDIDLRKPFTRLNPNPGGGS
jgi:hypothetical protein